MKPTVVLINKKDTETINQKRSLKEFNLWDIN